MENKKFDYNNKTRKYKLIVLGVGALVLAGVAIVGNAVDDTPSIGQNEMGGL